MKKHALFLSTSGSLFIKAGLLLAALLTLSACDDLPQNDPPPGLTLSESPLSCTVCATQTVLISGGDAPYTISGGDLAVATAVIAGDTITVVGLQTGAATDFTVTDNAGLTAALHVDVVEIAPYAIRFVNIPAGTFTMGALYLGNGSRLFSI